MEKIITGAVVGAVAAGIASVTLGVVFQNLALDPATSEAVRNVLGLFPMLAPDPLEFTLKLITWLIVGGIGGLLTALGIKF